MSPAEEAARDAHIEAHLNLAKAAARRYSRQCAIPFEDLFSYASIGLIRAAERWDETRGVPFPGFAWRYVRGAIIDGIRAETRCPQRPGFVHQRATFEPLNEGDETVPDPRVTAARLDAAIDVRSLKKLVDPRAVRIINSHFGAGRTFREIGQAEGIGEDRAWQILQGALATMRGAALAKKAA